MVVSDVYPVQVMKERGIPLPGKPKMLDGNMIRETAVIVIMDCSVQEVCLEPLVEHMEKKLGGCKGSSFSWAIPTRASQAVIGLIYLLNSACMTGQKDRTIVDDQ